MSQLVHRFDQQAIGQQVEIDRQAVELLPQAMIGNHSSASAQLSLAENEGQDGDIKIEFGDTQQPPRVAVDVSLHAGKDLRGMVLLPLRMQCERGIEPRRKNLSGHTKLVAVRLA